MAWDSDKGSWTTVYCAASGSMRREESGAYFQRLADPCGWKSKDAKDPALAERLDKWTREEMGRKGFIEEILKEGHTGS